MFALFLELSVIGWVVFLLSILCFFGSITSYRSGDLGTWRKATSFGWLIGTLVLMAVAFKGPLKDFVIQMRDAPDWVAEAKVFAKWGAAWLLCGLVTAFFYWISFVRDIRKVFDDNVVIVKERLAEVPFSLSRPQDATEADPTLKARALRSVTRALAVAASRFKGTNGLSSIFGRNYEMDLPGSLRDEATKGNGYDIDLLQVSWDEAKLDKLDAAVGAVIPPRVKRFKAEVTYAAIVWPMTAVSLVLADLLRHVYDYLIDLWHSFLDKVSRMAWGKEEAF